MFKFLKDKLKAAVSKFTQKVDEEAEEEKKEIVVEEIEQKEIDQNKDSNKKEQNKQKEKEEEKKQKQLEKEKKEQAEKEKQKKAEEEKKKEQAKKEKEKQSEQEKAEKEEAEKKKKAEEEKKKLIGKEKERKLQAEKEKQSEQEKKEKAEKEEAEKQKKAEEEKKKLIGKEKERKLQAEKEEAEIKKDDKIRDLEQKKEETIEEKSEEEIPEENIEKKGFLARLKDKFAKKEEYIEETTQDKEQDKKEVIEDKQEIPQKEDIVEKEEELSSTEIAKQEKVKEISEEKREKKAHEEIEHTLKEESRKIEKEEEIKSQTKEEETEVIDEKKGFLARLKQSITTKKLSEDKFEEIFWEIEVALLENSVAVEVIEKIKNDLKENIVDKPIDRKEIDIIVAQSMMKSITELFNQPEVDIIKNIEQKRKEKKPYVICFVGINGSGKTTTIAKFAYMLQKKGYSPIIAASDTFRAAAIDQLEIHAEKLNVKLIRHDYNSDPAAVAFDAIKHAEAKNKSVVLIDTAGRLHSNTNLMEELGKIVKVAKPDLTLFIGEAITGNDCIEQAREFNNMVNIDGIILSKADVDQKGGAAISISYVLNKPILYLGVGQNYEDLRKFTTDFILDQLDI
jgi:fused signal recognition particle receptor